MKVRRTVRSCSKVIKDTKNISDRTIEDLISALVNLGMKKRDAILHVDHCLKTYPKVRKMEALLIRCISTMSHNRAIVIKAEQK